MKKKKKIVTFTLAEGATHAGTCDKLRKSAFTLAEVLITLGIIGVVAALTIPTLIQNYQDRINNTAADVFYKKFQENLKVMNTQGVLDGYDSTESFVNELQKHMKVTKVCDNNHLSECFDSKIYANTYVDEKSVVNTSDFKTSSDMVNDTSWNTNVMGLQFLDGVTALLAYNPKCVPDQYNVDFDVMSCVGMIYDTNGQATPNYVSKDVRQTANTIPLTAIKINGVKITNIFWSPDTVTTAQCEEQKGDLGITYCPAMPGGNTYDRWAGSVKACGGVDKMASAEDLAKIASALYGTTIGAKETKSGLTFNKELAESFGFPTGTFRRFYTNENSNGTLFTSFRSFDDSGTEYNKHASGNRCNRLYVICVSK